MLRYEFGVLVYVKKFSLSSKVILICKGLYPWSQVVRYAIDKTSYDAQCGIIRSFLSLESHDL